MMQSQSQARTAQIKRRLTEAGVPFSLSRASDGLTRVWRVNERTMTTGQVERFLDSMEVAP